MVNKTQADKEIDSLFCQENATNILYTLKAFMKAVFANEADVKEETHKLEMIYKKSLYFAKPFPDQTQKSTNGEYLARLNEAQKGQPFRYHDIDYYIREDPPIE